MGGIFDFYTSKPTPTLNMKRFYWTILEIFYNTRPICVTPDSTISYIWATVKSLCSILPGYGWYICLLHIQDYPHTQYQAFLLYQFGEIQHKIPMCTTRYHNFIYLSYCKITLLNTPWLWVVYLSSPHPRFPLTQYQAFLLYQFGEIQHKIPMCTTRYHNFIYLSYCKITLLNIPWLWVVYLSSPHPRLPPHAISSIFTVPFWRYSTINVPYVYLQIAQFHIFELL